MDLTYHYEPPGAFQFNTKPLVQPLRPGNPGRPVPEGFGGLLHEGQNKDTKEELPGRPRILDTGGEESSSRNCSRIIQGFWFKTTGNGWKSRDIQSYG